MILHSVPHLGPIDFEVFNEAKDILGDRFPSLLDRFQKDTCAILSSIEFARASNDYDGIRDAAHSLKSASFQMGARHMSHYASAIEGALISTPKLSTIQDEAELDSIIENLRQAFSTYQEDVSSLI
ncbi:MAG: hypothetical protein COB76_00685 [Alphaproteobacteria bacterium]|nr:MAG: hypothetical protein COB76_00685 [Alphaproteobacteria bacterium]